MKAGLAAYCEPNEPAPELRMPPIFWERVRGTR